MPAESGRPARSGRASHAAAPRSPVADARPLRPRWPLSAAAAHFFTATERREGSQTRNSLHLEILRRRSLP